MKQIYFLTFAMLFSISTHSQSKDNDSDQPQRIVYNFIFNIVPDPCDIPLIGFVNIANGDFRSLQLGFVNSTFNDFRGSQIGFVNCTFNDHYGLQCGFVNTTFAKSNCLQWGFVNSAGSAQGGQVGFLNTVYKTHKGFQLGFVNTIRGMQIGPVKTTDETLNGTQIGFVNTTIGCVKGSQIGFVNYADTVSGTPIGFISIVRKGGYKAIELSMNEFYPVNLSFKIGVPKFYTFFQAGYNPDFKKQFASGMGAGSLLPIGTNMFFNPEISSLNSISTKNSLYIQSFIGNFRYKITHNLQIAAGPSVSHTYLHKTNDPYHPVYHIINHKINDNHRLVVSARFAVSVNF